MRALLFPVVLTALTCVTAAARADDLDALARAIDESPQDSRTYDAYATSAIKAKRFDDAIKKLKIAVARIPDYPEGYYKLGYAYRQKKEWADAADYYRRYIAMNPARTDTWYGLGAALEGLGDKKGAIAAYDKYVALEKSPGKQKFIDQARAEVVKLDPSRAPVVVANTPPVYIPPHETPPPSAQREPAQREPALPPVDFSQTPPTRAAADPAALRAQADELRKSGRMPEAAAAYKRAIDADRGNLDLYNDLGNVYFALKQYADAAHAFSDATRRDPSYALGWYNLAHALRKGDRPRDAAEAYRQYIKLKPDDPDPYYGLGQTLKMMGDASGAMTAFKKYIAMERRPEEQKWVDKARTELQALEAMQAKPQSSGKIEEKSTGSFGGFGGGGSGIDSEREHAERERLDRELRRDAVMPPSDDDMRLIDPFERGRLHDLKDPFRAGGEDDIVNPFAHDSLSPSAERLRQYEQALAGYRRALSRHAEDVSLKFERGVASALSSNASSALKAWNTVPLEDSEVKAARQNVERIRTQLLSRR
ncbi:MAG: repeat-containing protein [Myxococcales bacterium]|nr:repeat-containing protein [Myxococcales bacterium]